MASLSLQPYAAPDASDIAGDLRIHRAFPSQCLGRDIDITVWLPPGYDGGDERYPVLYLHDGTNLWDRAAAFVGIEWQVDEALTALAERGLPVIAVGMAPHPDPTGAGRMGEYSPTITMPGFEPISPHGADHRAFLVEELKPAVDAALRTRPEPAYTGIGGSSAGGTMSAWCWSTRPDVFGICMAMSPALFICGDPTWSQIEDGVAARAAADDLGRAFLSVGGREHEEATARASYVAWTEALVELLRDADVPVRYDYDADAIHQEGTWAALLPSALEFLARAWR